jgi:hypothetical protein
VRGETAAVKAIGLTVGVAPPWPAPEIAARQADHTELRTHNPSILYLPDFFELPGFRKWSFAEPIAWMMAEPQRLVQSSPIAWRSGGGVQLPPSEREYK